MLSSKISIQIDQKVSQALVGSQGCECLQIGMELKELTEFLTSSDLWMSHQFLDVGVELKSSRLVELSIDLAECLLWWEGRAVTASQDSLKSLQEHIVENLKVTVTLVQTVLGPSLESHVSDKVNALISLPDMGAVDDDREETVRVHCPGNLGCEAHLLSFHYRRPLWGWSWCWLRRLLGNGSDALEVLPIGLLLRGGGSPSCTGELYREKRSGSAAPR